MRAAARADVRRIQRAAPVTVQARLEGALTIRVEWDGGCVRGATVESSRPLQAANVLVGRQAADAVALVPLLFAICGRSQAVAAALACERATGVETPASVARARGELVDVETAHEYLWRILLDWPRTTGEGRDAPLLADLRRRIAEPVAASSWAMRFSPEAAQRSPSSWTEVRNALQGVLAERVFRAALGDWRDAATARDRFDRWIAMGKSGTARLFERVAKDAVAFGPRCVPLMPSITPRALLTEIVPRLDAPRFSAEPDWQGQCRETGALARRQAHPLVAELVRTVPSPVLPRMVARLIELDALLEGADAPRFGATAIAAGDAIAWVETARGLLLHRVAVVGGAVARYQIVAPTEWNFHPQGALATELAALSAPDTDVLRQRIDVLVQSLDPCVAYGVEVGKTNVPHAGCP
jgi:hypothetical protein